MKISFDFHSRVLLGSVAVLLLALSGSWVAIELAARHAGDLQAERRMAPAAAAIPSDKLVVPMDAVRSDLLVSGGLIAIVGLAVSLIGARLLVRPVRALTDATRVINASKEHAGPAATGDDLAHVANALHGLTRNAHYDALTGLPNRTLFNTLLDEGLERARRTKNSLAVAFIDLDGFKKINDTMGHKMGDLVLRKTAERLSRSVQAPSSISRLGGDEFVLILEGAGQSQALMAVERLMAAVRVPIRSPLGPIQVGMSAGIAIYPHIAVGREMLLKLADAAMYRSKARKCGPVVAKLGDMAPEPVPAAQPFASEEGSEAAGNTWSGVFRAPTATGAFRIKSLQAGNGVGARAAPIPRNEIERLTALRRLEILDKPPLPSFDRITQLAARSLDVPIALISLVDERRQWFLSRVGLEDTETPRDVSFCAHAVYARQPLVVSDATLDSRFADNALVIDEPHLRAYAGMPLFTQAGFAMGTLCAIDRRPRDFRADELKLLRDLAAIVEDLLQAREYQIASGRRPAKFASS